MSKYRFERGWDDDLARYIAVPLDRPEQVHVDTGEHPLGIREVDPVFWSEQAEAEAEYNAEG